MKLYFVRHGESFGNANEQYNMTMAGALTDRGNEQARELASRLATFKFDAAIVSPLERTVLTALPYLEAASLPAEAWPELIEMRGRKDIPTALPPEMRYGPEIVIPEAAGRHVRLRAEPEGRLLPPERESYEEGQRRVRQAAERIMSLWGGREATVLMVGHACNGARVLEALMKIELDGRFQHDNCGVTMMEQKLNGDFITRYVNRVAGPL
jgi:probable phosphoglycerate mutase